MSFLSIHSKNCSVLSFLLCQLFFFLGQLQCTRLQSGSLKAPPSSVPRPEGVFKLPRVYHKTQLWDLCCVHILEKSTFSVMVNQLNLIDYTNQALTLADLCFLYIFFAAKIHFSSVGRGHCV
jgi:hypothetical protein